MVFIIPFIGATALFSGFVSALPKPDSAIGDEVAVSAPNGVIMSDTAALAQQTGSPTTTSAYSTKTAADHGAGNSNWGYNAGGKGGYQQGGQQGGYTETKMDKGGSYTSTSAPSYSSSSPSYGSGSSNWGGSGSGYDGCVQQCIAQFGSPPSQYTPSSTSGSSSESSGSSGSGTTYTVIVAPTQGVLRYVPFALNASVGDTVKFMWGANNHTVTKSSALTPCNKTGDTPFASGEQNKDFVFTQVVNDTSPTFFYCGTPTHCQKGMFGIINPPNALGAPTSVSGMMSSMASNNSNIAAMSSYSSSQTSGNNQASTWGGSIDVSSLPDWSHQYVAENVLYTRNFLAANPEVINESGAIDLSAAGSTPLMIPQDITSSLNDAGSSSSASAAPTSTGAYGSSSASASPSAVGGAKSNSASSVASPRILVGIMAIIATFFAL